MKVETETDKYFENFNSELTQKDEVNVKIDNILNNYNLAKTLAAKTEESKQIYEEQSIHKLLIDYADIIYNNIKKLVKANIIQHIIHLLNFTSIA